MSTGTQVIVGRVRFIFFVLFLFALILVYRLYTIQIVLGEVFSLEADQQSLKPSSALLNRGSIYFTSKEGQLLTAAFQQSGSIVIINPMMVSDPKAVFDRINSNVLIDKEDFDRRVSKSDDPYEEIIKRVSIETGEKIVSPSIDGLQIYKQKWRAYPFNNLASNVLGFMAYSLSLIHI